MIEFSVSGLDETIKYFDKLGDKLSKAVFDDFVIRFKQEIEIFTPVKTGEMQESWSIERITEYDSDIFNFAHHAIYPWFGTYQQVNQNEKIFNNAFQSTEVLLDSAISRALI